MVNSPLFLRFAFAAPSIHPKRANPWNKNFHGVGTLGLKNTMNRFFEEIEIYDIGI